MIIMKRNIYGRIWGIGQILFWVILIPWTILTMPLNLYYESHVAPTWLAKIYGLPWVGWEVGVIIVSTFSIFLVAGGIIWLGWQMLHPITHHDIKISNHERLARVKGFSKIDFLRKTHEEAKEYQKRKFWQK
ncbi:hypothetical protein NEF87_003574 [Candidatus Lokiarchaeum ossiferum]|uniref:Poly-beta-1,6-N-acetyl-D-glucosamine biosynthesis protein PgaD n=1 Tax=Candidatus Lokiarchaeum ossiferum TaxID=2951803 RepID=A0ABY6HUV5_9ARCH|nr:hypothetical protein NEF87_003574 [Candidatus Lokiarchaeum sp. B-35]